MRFVSLVWVMALVLGGMACTVPALEKPAPLYLHIGEGSTAEGRLTQAWLEALRPRLAPADWHALHTHQELPTANALAWAALIRENQAKWLNWIDSLIIPFGSIPLPDTVTILVGHAGGEDAFTSGQQTIGFDISKLHTIYGNVTTSENQARMDRFFAHEMTHILHKAWRKAHPFEITSPLEEALWDCLVEGIGNYRSLSRKWVNADGTLTPHAEAILDGLQPILVARLVALSTAEAPSVPALLEGLSSGPFAQKWGALTTALWLAQEVRGNEQNLRPWIEAGPWGVLDLAEKYLPDTLAATLTTQIH